MHLLDQLDPNKPVLFLDLCGVIADTYLTRPHGVSKLLNDAQVKTNPKFQGDRIHLPTWEMFRALLIRYDVQVVIVSSWLRSYLSDDHPDVIALSEFLEYPLKGSLTTTGGFERGESVKRLVTELKPKTWLVVDDAYVQMYEDHEFFNLRHFVHPHGRFGVGGKELEKIHYILNDTASEPDTFFEKLFFT